MINAIKETWELIKEYDPENAKWYPLIALALAADIGIWCYMMAAFGPSL